MQNASQDKKILITSALPYVNNVPHLGNIIGCVLSADVFARFKRSKGEKVLYICGVDEHGTTTQAKAKEEGVSPKEICDKYFKIHEDIYKWFNISFDKFGRTSTKNHHERTQEFFKKIEQAGYIIEKESEQLYSEKSKLFLSDRFVEGTCPHCDFERARGDQCDGCGQLLNATDLINPVSTLDGTTPVLKKTTHLYLDLAKLQAELEIWKATSSTIGNWTQNAVTTTNGWFTKGLEPRAITRDLEWGIKVPKEGFENKVFYVWFDAPIGYMSITEQLLKDQWKDWWTTPNDTLLYQFMAKDNIPFHTLLFPAIELASQEQWTMLHHINATEYLNYETEKFSKSRGTGVFGDDAKNSGIPADVWRYYLLINRPEGADTTFLWDDFHAKLNNELVANIGNLVNRVMTFVQKDGGGVTQLDLNNERYNFWLAVQKEEQLITELLEEVKLKEALKKIMSLSKQGNQFFQEQAPWAATDDDKEQALFVLANLVKDLAILIEPYLPQTAASIFKQLDVEPKTWEDLGEFSIHGDLGKPELLFTKLDDKELKKLKDTFSGKQEATFGPEQLDLRVGKIIEIKHHPDAEKLYVETIDLGDLGTRTVVSGLVPFYKEEELLNKSVVVVANLKPANLRGVESQGMILAGEHKGVVEVVDASAGKPGDAVVPKGIEAKPKEQITIDEFFSLKLKVTDHKPCINAQPLEVNQKELKLDLAKGKLS